jgi:hypothetical protein
MREAIRLLVDVVLCPHTRQAGLRELRLITMPRVRWNKEAVPYLDMFSLVGRDSDHWYCWKNQFVMGVADSWDEDGEEMVSLCGASGKPFVQYGIPRKLLVDVPWTEYIMGRYGGE